MMFPVLTTVAMSLVVVFASTIQTMTGFGQGIISLSFWSVFSDFYLDGTIPDADNFQNPYTTLSVIACFVESIIAIISVFAQWRHVPWTMALLYTASFIPAFPLGYFLLTRTPVHILRIVIGSAFLVLFSFLIYRFYMVSYKSMPSSSTIQKDESEVKSLLPSGERSENVEHTNNSTSASVTIAESTHHAKHSLIDEPVMSTPLTVGLTLGMLFGGLLVTGLFGGLVTAMFGLKGVAGLVFFSLYTGCTTNEMRLCIITSALITTPYRFAVAAYFNLLTMQHVWLYVGVCIAAALGSLMGVRLIKFVTRRVVLFAMYCFLLISAIQMLTAKFGRVLNVVSIVTSMALVALLWMLTEIYRPELFDDADITVEKIK